MTAFRLVVRVDAVTEAALAGCCLGLALAAPHHGAWRLPADLAVGVWWVLAIALAGLAVLLWRWSSRPTRSLATTLAAGNAVTGLVILAYASIVDAGAAVHTLLIGAGVALVGLAAAQTVIARRLARRVVGP